MSHSAKNFCRGTLSVSLFSGIEFVWISGGGYQDSPSESLCLTVPKISVGESFTVALISGIEKVWRREGGGLSGFSVKNYLSHSAENFGRGTLSRFTNFGYRKSLRIRGGRGIKILRRKTFVLQSREIS